MELKLQVIKSAENVTMQSLQVINCSILQVCVLIITVYVAVLSVCPSGPLIGIKNFEL